MAKPGVKKGDRRGPYKPRAESVSDLGVWSADDHAHATALEADSPLASLATKRLLARRATEVHRRLVELDAGPLTVEEQKVQASLQTVYRKTLEALRVADKVRDEEDEL